MRKELRALLKVTLVVDNLAEAGLQSEHGLSFIVEADGGAVLFDAGQSDAWADNLRKLGGTPADIAAVAISHGHYDHTGGLARVAREAPKARFFGHPGCFVPKYALSDGGMRGIGMPADALRLQDAFSLSRSAVEIRPGIMLSGKIRLHKDVEVDTRQKSTALICWRVAFISAGRTKHGWNRWLLSLVALILLE